MENLINHLKRSSLEEGVLYLKRHNKELFQDAWLKGWDCRNRLSRASKRSRDRAIDKCKSLNGLFINPDLSLPIDGGELVMLSNRDFKEAQELQKWDEVLKGDKVMTIISIQRVGGKYLFTLEKLK